MYSRYLVCEWQIIIIVTLLSADSLIYMHFSDHAIFADSTVICISNVEKIEDILLLLSRNRCM